MTINTRDNEMLVATINDLTRRIAELETQETGAALWSPIQGIQEVTGAPAAIQWTGIDQTFERLRIIFYLESSRAAANDTLLIRFNGDSANNYDWRTLQLGAASANNAGVSAINWARIAATTATVISSGDFKIFDYVSTTKDKQVHGLYTADNNNHYRAGGVWSPGTPAAITQIDLLPSVAGTFSVGSWAQLYGLAKPS